MQILPSLLEYSLESLNKKLLLLKNSYVSSLTHSKGLHIHLDFVMASFAKSRSIMESLQFNTIHIELIQHYKLEKIDLTMHFMGESDDLFELYKTLEHFKFNPNWNYTFLVPMPFVDTFQKILQSPNSSVGGWCDLGEWTTSPQAKTILLMTVKAGLSGQVMTQQTKTEVIKFATTHPDFQFILDGGWGITDTIESKNVQLVSHTSFWKELSKLVQS